MDIPHFVYLFICHGHLGHSYSLAVVNHAATNTGVLGSDCERHFNATQLDFTSNQTSVAESYSYRGLSLILGSLEEKHLNQSGTLQLLRESS